jgi:hypothetical protein
MFMFILFLGCVLWAAHYSVPKHPFEYELKVRHAEWRRRNPIKIPWRWLGIPAGVIILLVAGAAMLMQPPH